MIQFENILNRLYIAGIIAILLTIAAASTLRAQDFKSEKDLTKNADKLFKDEQYVEAYPLFSQLLSLYPKNIDYNYKFSVCMLYADNDREKALPFLERVTKNSSANKKAYYYLGVAHHLNYQFKKAIDAYEKYKKLAPKKDVEEVQIQRKIDMCGNGLQLLKHKTELGVLKRTEIKESEYFRSYDMSLFGGKLLVKPDDFKSEADREKNEKSIIYLGKDAKILFYSSYGTSGESKDIYQVNKRPNGDWGSPVLLPAVINTEFDEDYPVMAPGSNTMYFCSKGHNSMGGYDIFKTTHDSATNTWSKPINLDFAINSADDDILYLNTKDEKTAYFSSNRSSITGMITVYKVKLETIPGTAPTPSKGEMLAIEEIKESAELNVNAKEVDFLEETAKSDDHEASAVIEAETFTELSDDQLITAAKVYANRINNHEKRLKSEAEASFSVARNKKELSDAKKAEAQNIESRINNISDPGQKEMARQKADNLNREAEQNAKEAELAFKIAKKLAADAEIKKQQATQANENAANIEQAVRSNQKDESISLLIEQKVLAESAPLADAGVAKIAADKELEAKLKENEASEYYEKIQFMESEIGEINDDIIYLREQAEATKDPTIKEEVLLQAEELEKEMNETEVELQATYKEAKVKENEAKAIKAEAAMLKQVSSEIIESSEEIQLASAEFTEPPAVEVVSTEEETEPLVSVVTEEPTEEASAVQVEEEVSTEATEPLVSIVTEEPSEEAQIPEETVASQEEETEPTPSEEFTQFDITESTVEEALTERDIVEEEQNIELLQKEAEKYNEEAQAIRTKAETIEDPEFRQNAINEAEKLEQAANAKQTEAAGSQAIVNSYNYRSNATSLEELAIGNEEITSSGATTVKTSQVESESLYEKATTVRENAATIEDPADKAAEFKKANTVEQQAIEVQTGAFNQTEFLANKKQIEEFTMGSEFDDLDKAYIEQTNVEAQDLLNEARMLREQTKSTENEEEKLTQMRTAKAIEQQAIQKQRSSMNKYNYSRNQSKLTAAITNSDKQLTEEEKSTMQSLQTDLNNLLSASIEIRTKAEVLEDPQLKANEFKTANDIEEQAIKKQRQAITIYTGEEELALADTSPTFTSSASEPEPIQTESISTQSGEATELRAKGEEQKAEAEKLFGRIDLIDDPDELIATLEKAEALEKQGNANIAMANKIESEGSLTSAVQDEPLVITEEPEPIAIVEETDISDEQPILISEEETTTEIVYTEEPVEPEPVIISPPVTPSTTAISSTLSSDVFTTGTSTVYSSSNPIPIDNAMPSGLIFKVQIGAFRNPIPQDLFKGISPIMGERTSMGFIRYTAGLFRVIESANSAKSTVRDYGYNDAFVVALYDGKRIPLNEARAMLASGEFPSSAGSATEIAGIDNAKTTSFGTIDLASIKELIYTVQVGVYSKPSNIGEKFGLDPLYSSRTSSGYIRYTSGIYKSANQATTTKNGIVQKGITDAFVTAYYNGERISLSQAQSIQLTDPGASGRRTSSPETSDASQENENVEDINVPNEIPAETGTATFKVQIGEFDNNVPVDEASTFIDIKDMGIDRFQDENSVKYTVGLFDNYDDAEAMRKTVAGKGVEGAFVVVEKDGKLIPMEEYLKSTIENEGSNSISGEDESAQLGLSSEEEEKKKIKNTPAELIQDLEKAFTDAINMQQRVKALMDEVQSIVKQAKDGSIMVDEPLISKVSGLMSEALATHEESRNAFEAANNLQELSRAKMIELGLSADEANAQIQSVEAGKFKEYLIVKMQQSAIQQLLQDIQNAHRNIMALQDSAQTLYDKAQMNCDSIMPGYSKEEMEAQMISTAGLVARAIALHERAEEQSNIVVSLENQGRLDMLMGTIGPEEISNYFSSITPSIFNADLIEQLPQIEIDKQKAEIDESYLAAGILQDSIRAKVESAKALLYSLTVIEDDTIAYFDETIWTVELVKSAFENAEFSLYELRCKMLLAGNSKDAVDQEITASSSFDEELLKPLSRDEIDELLAETRKVFNNTIELEDAAQAKIDEGKRRILAAAEIEFPFEREQEIKRAKALKVEGINEMEWVVAAQLVSENVFLINTYKFKFGGMVKEDADFQRLNYIPK